MAFEFLGMFFGDLNIFEILMMVIVLCVGIVLGLYFYIIWRPSNRVFYLKERDGRGDELRTKTEGPFHVDTQNPEYRFWKWGRSYEFVGRFKKKISTYFGKEGTAYTWLLQGFNTVPVGDVFFEFVTAVDQYGQELEIWDEWQEEAPEKFEIDFHSLAEAVKYRWGDLFWASVPEPMKEKLMSDKLLVTVELEPGFTPEGYQAITEADINQQGDEEILKLYAQSAKAALGRPIVDTVATMMAGGLVIIVAAILLGWIQVGGVTPA